MSRSLQKRMNGPGSLLMDQGRMRPVGDFPWLETMLRVPFTASTLLVGWPVKNFLQLPPQVFCLGDMAQTGESYRYGFIGNV